MSNSNDALMYLERMDIGLKDRSPEITLWENYAEGIQRQQFNTTRFRSVFGNLYQALTDNWVKLVIEASAERLLINGFRTGSGKNESDKDALQIWKDNFLDADYKIAHTEAIKLGHAYILIDGENKAFETESPLITVKHPSQAIVLHNPANPRQRIAGLHEWLDEYGRICATVYLPDAIYRYEFDDQASTEPKEALTIGGKAYPTDFLQSPTAGLSTTSAKWIPRKGVPFEVSNSLGVVPMIPLRNNPTLKKGGQSDIADVIPIQDAVNHELGSMLLASEFAAYPQRWAIGLEVPKDPETGQPLNRQEFISGPGRLWASEHPDGKFGQFETANLENYVHSIEMLIQHIAAITRTPPHYLLGQSGAFPSGDSLTATETGLTAKCRSKQSDFQTTWNEVLKLAFKAQGDPRAGEDIQTIWGDVEQRIYSQKVDGALKLSVLGTPQDALWEEIGKTPEQIERWHVMKEDMGQTKNSPEFAEESKQQEEEPPAPLGPEGNLPAEQAITTAERVGKINDKVDYGSFEWNDHPATVYDSLPVPWA